MSKLIFKIIQSASFFILFFILLSPLKAHALCNAVKVETGNFWFCDYNNNGQGDPGTPTEYYFANCVTGMTGGGTGGAGGGNEGDRCCSTAPECVAPTNTPAPTGPAGSPTPSGPIANPLEPPTDAFFDLVDPLQHGGGQTVLDDVPSAYAGQLRSPGGIVSRLLVFAFPLAGLILFMMLVWAGFEMLVGAPTKKSMDAGKQRATAALVGFLLLFATYWIFQIIEVVFGVRII